MKNMITRKFIPFMALVIGGAIYWPYYVNSENPNNNQVLQKEILNPETEVKDPHSGARLNKGLIVEPGSANSGNNQALNNNLRSQIPAVPSPSISPRPSPFPTMTMVPRNPSIRGDQYKDKNNF